MKKQIICYLLFLCFAIHCSGEPTQAPSEVTTLDEQAQKIREKVQTDASSNPRERLPPREKSKEVERTKEAPNKVPSYYAEIKQLLNKRCNYCHQSGSSSAINLTSYAKIKGYKESMEAAIRENRMPPWKTDTSCNEYKGNFDLEEKEREMLLLWLKHGMPKGDPSEERQSKPPILPNLAKVDVTLKTPIYKPRVKPDDYRCFVLSWPQKKDVFVTGLQIQPTHKYLVHHATVFVADASTKNNYAKRVANSPGVGYKCFGGPGGKADILGVWAPGSFSYNFPENSGIKVKKGSVLILQLHYNTHYGPSREEQTKVVFTLADHVAHEAHTMLVTDPDWATKQTMKIPAGQSNVTHSYAHDFFSNPSALSAHYFKIHRVMMHMHTRGKKGKMTIEPTKEKTKQCLLDIPRWDFRWQSMIELKTPVTIERGTKIRISCTWDNSRENQPVLEGKKQKPTNLNWGDGAGQEMCAGFVYITCFDKDGYASPCYKR